MSRRLLGALVCAFSLVVVPASAHDEPPLSALGHLCTPSSGVRVCRTTALSERVPSWDRVPLDVDVTVPAHGNGPFPTLFLLHGLGGTKDAFQSGAERGYNAKHFAAQGFAVVTPTARGYGRSCGVAESRTAGCEQGWTRMADIRYEVRDLQHLAGLLVDEGVADPAKVASTGVSYGGGMSMMLAFLRDRVMLPSGKLVPWKSPQGKPIALAAAWPRWGWSNGEAIFTRSGRDPWARTPIGAPVRSYAGGIFGVPFLTAFVAPTGGALSADLRLWKQLLDAGRLESAQVGRVLDNAYEHHGVAGLTGRPAPLLIQQGWTDALFPVGQALGAYDAALERGGWAALQLGDFGHAPGQNDARDLPAMDAQGLRFLKGARTGRASVTTYTMTCPKSGRSGGPITARSFRRLATRRFAFTADATVRISQRGAAPTRAQQLDPLSKTGGDLCTSYPAAGGGASIAVRSPGVTLAGQPVVTGRVVTSGEYGQIAARVWDRDPKTGRQRLVTRGVYRLANDQRGHFRFTLDGNAYRFAQGHRIVVELLGRDAPTYGSSAEPFTARLSDLRVALPAR
jgi:fermentation-respiration switch protein FrsA (DUF1100 family)